MRPALGLHCQIKLIFP